MCYDLSVFYNKVIIESYATNTFKQLTDFFRQQDMNKIMKKQH